MSMKDDLDEVLEDYKVSLCQESQGIIYSLQQGTDYYCSIRSYCRHKKPRKDVGSKDRLPYCGKLCSAETY